MWYILCLLGFLSLGGISAQAQPAASEGHLAQLKQDSLIFEQIIEQLLKQRFENPFALAAEPRASYLHGYGVVVSFHLKINRATMRSFYSGIINPEKRESRSKEVQVETVKGIVMQALSDYGNTLKSLPAEERLAICAHVEDRSELDPEKNRVDLVVSVQKSDIEALVTRVISPEQFKGRVTVSQY